VESAAHTVIELAAQLRGYQRVRRRDDLNPYDAYRLRRSVHHFDQPVHLTAALDERSPVRDGGPCRGAESPAH